MEHVNWIKGAAASVVAVLTALWGWFGWLVVLWVSLMVVDYVTGSLAAVRAGEWSSKAARDGIWHKAGSIVIVVVAGAADLLVGTMLEHIPGVALPFSYTVLLCPIVVVWYCITEMGSIIENAVALGAPAPAWLAVVIDKLQDAVDTAGEAAGEDEHDSRSE